MPRTYKNVLFILACVIGQPVWAELSETVVQKTFYPYTTGKSSVEALASGTTISRDSWEAAKDYVPTEILDKIKAGDLSFTVQETTNLPVSEEYIQATKQYAEQVKLGAQGELEGYVSGL